MSRRFGRNQKRAMRRELENWQQAHAMTEGLLKHVSRQRDRLQDDLETVRATLGPMFIGLPVTDLAIKIDTLYADTFRMPVQNMAEVVTMHAMRVRDLSDSNDPRCRLHVRVRLADGEVAYAMSEQALFGHPEADSVLVGHIVRELAPHLMKVIRQIRGRR